MYRSVLGSALMAFALLGSSSWAQPGGVSGFPEESPDWVERTAGRRMERIVDYLELSEAQAADWRQVMDRHATEAELRRFRCDELRSEFQALAAEPSPNLEAVGRVALAWHREREAARLERERLSAELAALLTPEQAERFEALKLARESGGRHGPLHGRHRPRWRGPE